MSELTPIESQSIHSLPIVSSDTAQRASSEGYSSEEILNVFMTDNPQLIYWLRREATIHYPDLGERQQSIALVLSTLNLLRQQAIIDELNDLMKQPVGSDGTVLPPTA